MLTPFDAYLLSVGIMLLVGVGVVITIYRQKNSEKHLNHK